MLNAILLRNIFLTHLGHVLSVIHFRVLGSDLSSWFFVDLESFVVGLPLSVVAVLV